MYLTTVCLKKGLLLEIVTLSPAIVRLTMNMELVIESLAR